MSAQVHHFSFLEDVEGLAFKAVGSLLTSRTISPRSQQLIRKNAMLASQRPGTKVE